MKADAFEHMIDDISLHAGLARPAPHETNRWAQDSAMSLSMVQVRSAFEDAGRRAPDGWEMAFRGAWLCLVASELIARFDQLGMLRLDPCDADCCGITQMSEMLYAAGKYAQQMAGYAPGLDGELGRINFLLDGRAIAATYGRYELGMAQWERFVNARRLMPISAWDALASFCRNGVPFYQSPWRLFMIDVDAIVEAASSRRAGGINVSFMHRLDQLAGGSLLVPHLEWRLAGDEAEQLDMLSVVGLDRICAHAAEAHTTDAAIASANVIMSGIAAHMRNGSRRLEGCDTLVLEEASEGGGKAWDSRDGTIYRYAW